MHDRATYNVDLYIMYWFSVQFVSRLSESRGITVILGFINICLHLTYYSFTINFICELLVPQVTGNLI